MRVRFFMIPFDKLETKEKEINEFLEKHKGTEIHWFLLRGELGVEPGLLAAVNYKEDVGQAGFHADQS